MVDQQLAPLPSAQGLSRVREQGPKRPGLARAGAVFQPQVAARLFPNAAGAVFKVREQEAALINGFSNGSEPDKPGP